MSMHMTLQGIAELSQQEQDKIRNSTERFIYQLRHEHSRKIKRIMDMIDADAFGPEEPEVQE